VSPKLPARIKDDRRQVTLAVVREYQSEVAALREQPYPRGAGLTIQALFAFFAFGILFSYFARIDRVVSASGALAPEDPALVYQALDPSIIRSLDVKEGQRVGKGHVLATLDPTFATAQVNQLRAQTDILRAQIARDTAIISQTPLVFPVPSSDQVARYQRESMEYYKQQIAQFSAGVNNFDQQMATLRTTIEKFKVDEARYQKESEANGEIEKMRITLEKHGTGSMLNLLSASAAKIETQRQADYSHNSRIEAEHNLAAAEAQRKAFIEQFKANVSQDLLTARNTLETALPQLDAALKHQELVRWTAPEDCIVLTVAPNMSVGSVVQQGTTIISLMPVRDKVNALVRIPADQIAFVKPGDPASLKVGAFNSSEHGTLEGVVKWVGDNALTTFNNQTVDPYYNAQVAIERNHLVNIPSNASLLPGMTLAADIKVGTRSIWNYLVGGMTRGVGESMREP
jgi:hemolysin D